MPTGGPVQFLACAKHLGHSGESNLGTDRMADRPPQREADDFVLDISYHI